jgi:hypothetical protein
MPAIVVVLPVAQQAAAGQAPAKAVGAMAAPLHPSSSSASAGGGSRGPDSLPPPLLAPADDGSLGASQGLSLRAVPPGLPYSVVQATPTSSSLKQRQQGTNPVLGLWAGMGLRSSMDVFAAEEAEALNGRATDAAPLFVDSSLRPASGLGGLGAATTAVAVARAQHYLGQQAANQQADVSRELETLEALEATADRALQQQQQPVQEGKWGAPDAGAGAAGAGTVSSPSARHPSAVPGSASSRETESQRARLRALQQRQQQQQLEARPKVRNYAIRDENDGDED